MAQDNQAAKLKKIGQSVWKLEVAKGKLPTWMVKTAEPMNSGRHKICQKDHTLVA